MARFLVLNGPNLNLLGKREPEHYGSATLQDIEQELTKIAQAQGHELVFFQSNAEHELVDRVQALMDSPVDFVLINPAAFTHTSVAIRDALAAVQVPFIEIHLSNIYRRESFRSHSYFSDQAVGVISGLGAQGYRLALEAAIQITSNNSSK